MRRSRSLLLHSSCGFCIEYSLVALLVPLCSGDCGAHFKRHARHRSRFQPKVHLLLLLRQLEDLSRALES